MERRERKLLKYLHKDRFKKFKSYADKHGMILRDIRTENGENLLHEACRLGKGYLVRYFLEKGVDPMFQNERGEFPLHVACQRAVLGGLSVLDDLVKPLMRKCFAAAEVVDNRGRKPRDFLKELHEKVAVDETEQGSTNEVNGCHDNHGSPGRRTLRDEKESDEDEDKWRKKLAQEMNDEYAEEWGNYENDYVEPEREPDTFDNWAENIHQQRRVKRQHNYITFEEQRERKRKKKEEDAEENRKRLEDLEREHQKYLERAKDKGKQKLNKEKKRYSTKIRDFFVTKEGGKTIGFEDIPWPHLKTDDSLAKMKEFLLCDIDTNDVTKVKKYFKEQQIIWHPDRFSQKCGQYLLEEENEKIMQKVNSISQQLNAYLTEIT